MLTPAVIISSLAAVSCSEDIVIDRIDEGAYENVNSLIGSLRDANTGDVSTIVEMFRDSYSTSVAFTLSRPPKAGVDVQVEYDGD